MTLPTLTTEDCWKSGFYITLPCPIISLCSILWISLFTLYLLGEKRSIFDSNIQKHLSEQVVNIWLKTIAFFLSVLLTIDTIQAFCKWEKSHQKKKRMTDDSYHCCLLIITSKLLSYQMNCSHKPFRTEDWCYILPDEMHQIQGYLKHELWINFWSSLLT